MRKVISTEKNASILEVAKKLRRARERHIIVTESEKPIGIISTTDINNRVVAENKNPKETKAEEIMTSPIMSCDVEESLAKVYFEMLRENIFSCPVVKKGRLAGTLDLKEAMNHLIKAKVEENVNN